MVNAQYDKNENLVIIKIKGNNFDDILGIFHEHHCSYEEEGKYWTASPNKAFLVLREIADGVEDVHISKEDIDLIKKNRFSFGNKETSLLEVNLNDEFFKAYPPIVGKAPHENFQYDCIERGLSRNKFAFFLGMGSGKTYIVAQVLNHLIEQKKLDRVLVVTPPEGVVNWRREILNFSPFFKKSDIVISTATKNRNPFESDPKIIIMTYRHYLTLSDDFQKLKHKRSRAKKYRKPVIPFDTWGTERAIVLDESHNIKNYKARQTHVIELHKKSFQYRYLLTGTPSPNNFGELYAQMRFLDSSIVPPDYYEWLGMVADMGNKYSKYAVNYFYKDEMERWEKIFYPWVSRFTSDEILDLPELSVNKIYAEMTDIQEEIYKKLIEHVIYTIKEDNNGQLTVREMKNKFAYISMALDNPLLLKGKIDNDDLAKLINKFKFERDHGKFNIVTSLIDRYINEEKRKVILFDFHPLTLDYFNDYYQKSKMNPLLIHGQNTPQGVEAVDFRAEVMDKFKTSKTHNLLIASSRVLKTAANLQEATRGVYFSRDYSYLAWSQSQKRMHRYGQANAVIINPLIFEESLDVRLDISLEDKGDLDKNLFGKESLSIEEWRKVFKGEM